MVTHKITKKEQAELKKTLNIFYSNGDGKIDLQEFIDSYKKVYEHLNEETVKREAHYFFVQADVDKNGSI